MTNKNESNNGDKSVLSTRSDARSVLSVRSANSINRAKDLIQERTSAVQMIEEDIKKVKVRLNKLPDIPDLSWLRDEASEELVELNLWRHGAASKLDTAKQRLTLIEPTSKDSVDKPTEVQILKGLICWPHHPCIYVMNDGNSYQWLNKVY